MLYLIKWNKIENVSFALCEHMFICCYCIKRKENDLKKNGCRGCKLVTKQIKL